MNPNGTLCLKQKRRCMSVARVKLEGLDTLMLSMKEVSEIPEDVANEMLQAGGAIVADAQRRRIRSTLRQHTGNLADSIKVTPKIKVRNGGLERFVTIYPYGKHHVYTKRSEVKAYKRSKHGRTYTVGGGQGIATNNDVAFVHEYGSKKRGISAKGIMRAANEESAAAAVEAEYRVYDNWLKSKGM